ncbi:MAG: ActS/PrrB/RegB family redox-sensitive histidine kinase [Rhodobacteraceae bacterium]|nr:ActS/PrrB/RegB family redox-sensitive histidine kinase [Paracoccaceae bacterium]
MARSENGEFSHFQPDSWVRLRTLVALRWVAILGQVLAVMAARHLFNLDLDMGLFAAAIGLSVLANTVFIFVYPQNKRLAEREVAAMLMFDTFQIAAVLFLSGGLNNPFAILIVAPVTVAATALTLRSTFIVALVAYASTTLIAFINLPLQTEAGVIMRMPDIFIFGFWGAILITIGFLGLYAHQLTTEMRSMSQALLATQMALAREQKLTDLGGVVAAAAHELGTPLATITLVSSELADELQDNQAHLDDAKLIREQADRCRDILRSMGKVGKDDMMVRQVPLSAIVEEAAEPHANRGISIRIQVGDDNIDASDQPVLIRRPEIVHGLRNLIQNAVDFASSTIWIDLCWTDRAISIRIADDGAGYAPHVIGNIGEPFVGRRKTGKKDKNRPEYEGMGLGLFIAKTLLERTGAELSFSNGTDPYTGEPHPGQRSGAIVVAIWDRGPQGIEAEVKNPALAENVQFAV